MKYSVRKRKGLFCVHELKTDQIIEKFELKEEASALARFLESGGCLLYTSPSPRDVEESRMPSSA